MSEELQLGYASVKFTRREIDYVNQLVTIVEDLRYRFNTQNFVNVKNKKRFFKNVEVKIPWGAEEYDEWLLLQSKEHPIVERMIYFYEMFNDSSVYIRTTTSYDSLCALRHIMHTSGVDYTSFIGNELCKIYNVIKDEMNRTKYDIVDITEVLYKEDIIPSDLPEGYSYFAMNRVGRRLKNTIYAFQSEPRYKSGLGVFVSNETDTLSPKLIGYSDTLPHIPGHRVCHKENYESFYTEIKRINDSAE